MRRAPVSGVHRVPDQGLLIRLSATSAAKDTTEADRLDFITRAADLIARPGGTVNIVGNCQGGRLSQGDDLCQDPVQTRSTATHVTGRL